MLTICAAEGRDLWQHDCATVAFVTLLLKIAPHESHRQKQTHNTHHLSIHCYSHHPEQTQVVGWGFAMQQ